MDNKLSLVNHLLQTVGERRTVTLETGNPSVQQAEQALDSYNLDFQSKGWWFNRRFNVRLLPDSNGEINLPEECLSFIVWFYDGVKQTPDNKVRFVQNGTKLFDTQDNTFKIGKAVSGDLVLLLGIELMPQIAKTYLKHWAAEQYYIDDDGDLGKAERLERRTALAFEQLNAQEIRNARTNALDSPQARYLTYRIYGAGRPSSAKLLGGSW